MSDELRAAAERIVSVLEDKAMMLPSGPPSDFDKDVGILADHYLAEHPADDGEAVSEEWLRAVGFTPAPNDAWLESAESLEPMNGKPIRLAWYRRANPFWQWSLSAGEERDDPDMSVDLHSRGHVRRLCQALGIPLNG